MDLSSLFNAAMRFAETYDGSESAYNKFMGAAVDFDEAGGHYDDVSGLLDTALRAITKNADDQKFFDILSLGGAQVFHHEQVFVTPENDKGFITHGEGEYVFPEYEFRLREVVLALHSKGIYFDDLLIDGGTVSENQARKWPYTIISIPRLHAQIAVANQKGEALFIAKPSLPYETWIKFEKKMAGKEDSIFENIRKINHIGAWQERMINYLFGEDGRGQKIDLITLTDSRRINYILSETIVVEIAREARKMDSRKQWPTKNFGIINPDIVRAVTGDDNWPTESWASINKAGQKSARGLSRDLAAILDAHDCNYNLSDIAVINMAKMTRHADPDKRWPTRNSGKIDPSYVFEVTDDPDWQTETWEGIDEAGKNGERCLTKALDEALAPYLNFKPIIAPTP